MVQPTFHIYPEMAAKSKEYHYSQATLVNGIVKTSGQGGWDATGGISPDSVQQVKLAFQNVEHALQSAHPNLWWKNVYAVRSYHTNIEETAELIIQGFRKHMPEHQPVWTCVEVTKLGIEGMQVEIEVEAKL